MKDFNYYIYVFTFSITLWLTGIPNTAMAQRQEGGNKILTGMVMSSEDDEYLVGVHIFAKIAHVGEVSDQNGLFNMMVDVSDTLIVTFVGFKRQVIPLSFFREKQIDLVIRMDPGIIELPGITIVGQPNIDYLKRPERSVMRIPGLQAPAPKPDVDVPVGSLNYGPLSRWGKEAKEKRKLMEIYQEGKRERIYVQTVSSDSVRAVFMFQYGVNEKEYNDFIIFFNTYKPLVDRQDSKDIIRVMHQTFIKYKPKKD